MTRVRDERGTVTVLIIGFVGVLVLLVAVVVDASAAYLRRQELAGLADGAALAAVDAGASGSEVYAGGLGTDTLTIDPVLARQGALAYLAGVGARGDFAGLVVTVQVQGERVVVHLAAPLDLPFSVPGSPSHPRVSAEGSASAVLDAG